LNQPLPHTFRAVSKPVNKKFLNAEEDFAPLLEACRRGDRKGQETLYKRFYGYAMGICLRYARSREEAMEILNDGFFKIMTNLDKYSPGLSFKGWLRRIMINASIDHFRRYEKHYNGFDISYVKHEGTEPETWNNLSEEVILKAIQQLPPSYRMVFNLYVIEGYKHDEIAQKLGISTGTSKSNLNVARAKLMKVLGSEFDQKIERNG
jgi:RNA polymerase sigma-70 factor (ECF subfamily)